MNIKIIVSHNYLPCDEAKKWYEGKEELVHVCSSASLKKEDFDEWAKEHLILDTDCQCSCPELNFTMCELTNLYAGSRLPEVLSADYVGLCHYRRLFNIEQVKSAIEKSHPDIICATPAPIGTIGAMLGIRAQYEAAHVRTDFNLLENAIKETELYKRNPDVLQRWQYLIKMLVAPCNCFVMRCDVFQDYRSSLFNALFSIWDKLKDEVPKRDNYQRRAIGFLGERFTSWYVTAQHFNGKTAIQLPLEVHQDWKPKTATDDRK